MTRLKQLFLKLISFSKTESNGALILFLLIALCIAAPSVFKLIFGAKYMHFVEDEEQLKLLVHEIEEVLQPKERDSIQLKLFNPNSATISDLNALGVPPFLSRRIDNYRNSGGRFTIKSDLSKIYDFPDSIYLALKDYIDLPEKMESNLKVSQPESDPIQRNIKAAYILKEPRYPESALIIDINKADSLEFKKLYGIGSSYARRLVAFREALGGYHSVDQVRDMYGMTDSLFWEIKSFLHVSDTVSLKTININLATFQQLNAHPYISFELTKEILAAKSKYGKFKQPEDLNRLSLLDSTGRKKLRPYLKF